MDRNLYNLIVRSESDPAAREELKVVLRGKFPHAMTNEQLKVAKQEWRADLETAMRFRSPKSSPR
jgi:hypothetical protein